MQVKTNVKVNIDSKKISKEFKTKNDKAIKILKNEIAKDTEPLVPMRDGTLRRAVVKSIRTNEAKLVWLTPYARFLYYAKVMVGRITKRAWAKKGETKVTTNKDLTYSQPGTGGMWFEKAKRSKLQKWLKVARKVYK